MQREIEELAKKIRIDICDIYQEVKDMGNAEFTTRYNQDCLKILIADCLAKKGYRKPKETVGKITTHPGV